MRTSPLPRAATALIVSVLAGLLVAGLAFPLVGGPALAAKSAADDFLELPVGLTSDLPPTRTRMLDADGGLIATLFLENRVNVRLDQVPEHVQQAVIAIEDSRFYEHNGVDTKGTLRAAVNNTSGGSTQGGSTLTQQYVKNALLAAANDEAGQKAATEQSVQRKLREARYALAIEKQLSKDEILTRYLNIAYFGNGAYGIAAAAQYYWGKPVQKLTIAQGAMLAGLVQNPSRFDPTDKEKAPGVVVRRNLVLKRMADLGFLSEQVRQQGSALPLALDEHPVGNGCDSEPVGAAAFFCDYVRKELETTDVGKALGETLQEKQRAMFSGLTIHTTLDRGALDGCPGRARGAGAERGRPLRRRRRRARHRPHQGDGGQPGLRREGGPDQGQLRDRRQLRLPARLDLQGLRARRRDPAGHPAGHDLLQPGRVHLARLRQLHRERRSRTTRSTTPRTPRRARSTCARRPPCR